MMLQMLEYQSSLRRRSMTQTLQDPPATSTTPGRRHIHASSASPAARAQLSGFARIKIIERSLSNPIIIPALSINSSTSGLQQDNDSEATLEDRGAADQAADQAAVEEHWKRYIDEGVIDDPENMENFDILFYWQVCIILSNSMISIWLSICKTCSLFRRKD